MNGISSHSFFLYFFMRTRTFLAFKANNRGIQVHVNGLVRSDDKILGFGFGIEILC